MTQEREQSDEKISLGQRVVTLASRAILLTIVGGGAGMFLWQAYESDGKVREYERVTDQYRRAIDQIPSEIASGLDKILGQIKPANFDPNTLNAEAELNPQGFDAQQTAYLFHRTTDALNSAFYEFARRPDTENVLPIFRQIALEHLFGGLQSLNIIYPEQKATFSSEDGKMIVVLDNERYDISQPLQFQVLFALTSLKLDEAGLDADLNRPSLWNKETMLYQKAGNNLNQQAVVWLKNQNLEVGLLEKGLLLADPQSLATFARVLKWTNQLGYPNPRIGIFNPDQKWGGRYLGRLDPLTNKPTTIDYLDPYGLVDSLVHEIGHGVEDFNSINNSEFSLKAFGGMITEVEKVNWAQVQNTDKYKPYLSKDQENPRKEQYATLFTEYFSRGEIFRAKISELTDTDPAAADILKTSYNFFKNLFDGRSFLNGGITPEDLEQQFKANLASEEKVYAIGKQALILDKAQENPGVLLRQFAGGGVSPETMAVFDNDWIEIIDGPILVSRQVFNFKTGKYDTENTNWWKVKLNRQSSQNYLRVGRQKDATGWIAEKYLGESWSNKK